MSQTPLTIPEHLRSARGGAVLFFTPAGEMYSLMALAPNVAPVLRGERVVLRGTGKSALVPQRGYAAVVSSGELRYRVEYDIPPAAPEGWHQLNASSESYVVQLGLASPDAGAGAGAGYRLATRLGLQYNPNLARQQSVPLQRPRSEKELVLNI